MVKPLSNIIQGLHSIPSILKPSIYACIYLLVDFFETVCIYQITRFPILIFLFVKQS